MRFAVHGPAQWLEGFPRCHRPSDGDVSDVLGRVHVRVIGMTAGATVEESGSRGALLRPGPLRTGLAGFPRTSAQASLLGVAGFCVRVRPSSCAGGVR